MVLGCLLILAGVGYFGVLKYFSWRETVSPSTSRVLVLKDGRRIPLQQPTAAPRPPATPTVQSAPPAPGDVPQPAAAPRVSLAVQDQVMPPVRLEIPSIKVNWPVVLNNGIDLPKFKGIGWMLGSAFPGAAGNMVLFGHLDGPYATLGRLHELKPGDTFNVRTEDAQYNYRVTSLFQTTPDDVGVMAPTDGPTATLITCSGHWDTARQTYDHRLIVSADYVP